MSTLAKKGAVALMRRSAKELRSAMRKYETAHREWRAIRHQMSEYKRYTRADRHLRAERERFAKLFLGLPHEVQKELAREFWPNLDNIHEAFDANSLPIRIGRQNIRGKV